MMGFLFWALLGVNSQEMLCLGLRHSLVLSDGRSPSEPCRFQPCAEIFAPTTALWEPGPGTELCKYNPKARAGFEQKICRFPSLLCLATSSHFSVHPNWNVTEPGRAGRQPWGQPAPGKQVYEQQLRGTGAGRRLFLIQEQSSGSLQASGLLGSWGWVAAASRSKERGAQPLSHSPERGGPWGSQVRDKAGVRWFSLCCSSEEGAAVEQSGFNGKGNTLQSWRWPTLSLSGKGLRVWRCRRTNWSNFY